MSGHSKWSSIKRQKQSQDLKRGKLFSKISRSLSIAARKGLDLNFNPDLKRAAELARSVNMPVENIKRAIEKGGEGGQLEEFTLEGYGPEGVAFLLLCVSDNRNRTIADVRRTFFEYGGSLGEKGSTAFILRDPENPTYEIPLTDPEKARKVLSLAKALDDNEDIQEVWANFDIPNELLTQDGE